MRDMKKMKDENRKWVKTAGTCRESVEEDLGNH